MKISVLSLAIVLFVFSAHLRAEESVFFTVSKQANYHDALNELSEVIGFHDYKLIKIQPIDKGLRSRGYRVLDYKVLFFSNEQQVNDILAANPRASALLPMRIILYKNGNKVIASTPNMRLWKSTFGKNLQPMLEQWDKNVRAIMTDFASH
ncbi:MAG: DUF302 domain-containing protein [Gammaproteobacteria bacterium]|jgi:uncharacterized protein (DUF302 family)